MPVANNDKVGSAGLATFGAGVDVGGHKIAPFLKAASVWNDLFRRKNSGNSFNVGKNKNFHSILRSIRADARLFASIIPFSFALCKHRAAESERIQQKLRVFSFLWKK